MAAPPLIPLTWRNVSGPSNASALNLMRQSGQDLGSAIEGLGTNVDQYADEKQKRETDAFIAELGALPDDAARQDALKQAETGWMNLDRINTATTDLQAGDYTTAASARAQILGDIDVKTQVRGEESRVKTDEILSNPDLTATGLNEAALQLTQGGWKDHGGRLKARANEIARNTDTGITEDFIQTQITDPTNEKSYTRATYNTIVNNAYNKLKEAHPYADESVLKQRAKEAITRTEAGTLFERQKWFEELERPGVRAEQEAIRKKAVGDTWRENKAAVTSAHKAYSTSQKALKIDPKNAKLQAETSTARADFRTKINNLNEQFKNNEDSLGPGAATRLQSWNEQAVSDYTQYDLDPDASYLEMHQEYEEVVNEKGETVQIAAPLGIEDYSPTNQQEYIDAEINKLTLALPHASAALIETKVLEKIKKSGLAVQFAAGALPAKLAAARQKYKFETADKRSKRRHVVLDAIGDSPQKNVSSYMYGELTRRFAKEGEPLDPENLKKLRRELAATVSQWKDFIPNWDKLGLASKETYQIAMVNILQGAQLDRDANFLWLDKHDFPLPALTGSSATNDMSKIGKNAILAALAEHISPFGVGIDSYNKQSGVPNAQLLASIQKEMDKDAAKEAAKRKKLEETRTRILEGPHGQ